jgi:CheY-like chemotaxis protein
MSSLTVLVVEDEALLALDLEDTLEDLGWRVAGSMGGVREALAWLDAREAPRAAVLDVNLGGEVVFPVAEALRARQVPFVFATAYADVVGRSGFSDATVLNKPVNRAKLKAALDVLLAA